VRTWAALSGSRRRLTPRCDVLASRRFFLTALGAFTAAPELARADEVTALVVIPTVYEAGRFFATPRVASDGTTMKLWLDTDGGGFIFSESVAKWKLPIVPDPNGKPTRWTRLPAFAPEASIPAPAGRDGRLVVFTRDAAARRDPILMGFDGQLGASWFQGRRWTFDYPGRRVLLRGPLTAEDGMRVRVAFPHDASGSRVDGGEYPNVVVTVDGAPHAMAFDVAATVALTAAARKRFSDGAPGVRATSFVKRSVLAAWRAKHPDWPVFENVSVTPGIAAIRVPSVRLEAINLGPVWFTTRPGDDVFDGPDASLDGKLGAPAFFDHAVTLDYPRGVLAVR
jgi:hypothetical protein